MRSTKVYQVLSVLDKVEHNRLRKYLSSPYFNPNATLVVLFDILGADIFRKSGSAGVLSKEEVWDCLGLERSYDDVYFRRLCADLLKLTEGYLAQQLYEQDEAWRSVRLIEAVSQRKLEPLYSSAVRSARAVVKKERPGGPFYHLRRYELERILYDLQNIISYNRLERSNIEEMMEDLDQFYLAEKLKYYCIILGQRSFSTHDYESSLIEDILSHIASSQDKVVPAVRIYYQISLTQRHPDELSHYHELRALITAHIEAFPQQERYFIFNFALNYAIRRINRGHEDFLGEYYGVYREALELGVLFSDGQLSPWHFRNIVGVALRLGHYEWADDFIGSYSEFLPPEKRDNAVTFNRATLYFYQKKFRRVIELLREVEYEELTYNLNSKNMLLLTYYELDEIDPLYSLMESFRVWLNRHKDIATPRRQSYQALISFTRKLTRIAPGDTRAIEKLRNEIGAHQTDIASEKWLKEKLEELS